jgi:hypothetical protein
MPRWLIAFIVAFVLPCYGLAAVADTIAPASQAVHAPADAAPVSDEAATAMQADAVTDGAELFDNALLVHAAVATSAAPPQAVALVRDEPFLDGPKRPPRARAV